MSDTIKLTPRQKRERMLELGMKICNGKDCTCEEVYERASLGIFAGYWCDKHWETAPYRKEGAEGFDAADWGEHYDDDY